MAELQSKFENAKSIESVKPKEAVALYRAIVFGDSASDAESIKVKESSIQNLGDLYARQEDGQALRTLLTELQPLFKLLPKAKTAKIVRTIIDTVGKVPGTTALQLSMCKEQVEIARTEKRTFLRQRIEARLANLYLETKDFPAALALIGSLLTEVKRLDDKLLLVDIHLLESRVHHALRNLPKAKAALTAARTAANAIYVPPAVQANIDMQSGTLHAEEKDYKTGYSYFYEGFEQLTALDDPKAVHALKYMLLCKVMINQADEVPSIISSKGGLKYTGDDVDAMKAVASAYTDRSLQEFEAALGRYREQLANDPIIHNHLSALYDTLLEQNLCRLIEPFSRVEIAHVAHLIELPLEKVEAKLSQMILDKKFAGTLDQGAGCLIVFDDIAPDSIYPSALETFGNMSKVVDSLFKKSTKIFKD